MLAVVSAGWPALRAHLRAISLLARASGQTGTLASLYDSPIRVENLLLVAPDGPFRARIYAPRDGRPARGIVLAHGVHYLGIDEPRLIPFARNLARVGTVVITPELTALADYRVDASSIAQIAIAARTLARRPGVAPGGVGILGLSFAGGLGLLAAARPEVRPHVAFVAAMGGHYDLARVSRFLATDTLETPDGTRRMHAHDYGLLVYFYAHADRFVAPEQLPLFRDALRQWLHLDLAAGQRAARQLTGDARTLFDRIARLDKPALAPLVLAAMPSLRQEFDALSPAGHLAPLQGLPVYLLHGSADDVVPAVEAEAIARELAPGGAVHLLLSPNIKHVTVEGAPTPREQWRLIHALAGMLGH